MKNHENARLNNSNRSTENIENTTNVRENNGAESVEYLPGVSSEQVSDSLNGDVTSPDKVLADVRVIDEKLAEMQDKYLRLSAEFDNYRKRTLREKIELSKYAGENLLLSFLPIMDDFERALKHMDSTTDCTALKDGIDIMYVKFSDFLKQNGIKEIESLNTNFNVCLLYTSDAADEEDSVDLGGRRI